MKGLLGRKLGMTQVFTVDGELIPVTVIEATPNVVLQKKTVETDGYEAVQLGFEDIKERRRNKSQHRTLQESGNSTEALCPRGSRLRARRKSRRYDRKLYIGANRA